MTWPPPLALSTAASLVGRLPSDCVSILLPVCGLHPSPNFVFWAAVAASFRLLCALDASSKKKIAILAAFRLRFACKLGYSSVTAFLMLSFVIYGSREHTVRCDGRSA